MIERLEGQRGFGVAAMSKNIQSNPTAPIGAIDLDLVRRNLNDAQRAIASVNYSDVWKRVGMLIKCGRVTIDTKKSAHGKGMHLQVHVNDEDGSEGKPLAKITIDDALKQYAGANDAQIRKLVQQVIKGAL